MNALEHCRWQYSHKETLWQTFFKWSALLDGKRPFYVFESPPISRHCAETYWATPYSAWEMSNLSIHSELAQIPFENPSYSTALTTARRHSLCTIMTLLLCVFVVCMLCVFCTCLALCYSLFNPALVQQNAINHLNCVPEKWRQNSNHYNYGTSYQN